jgi:hypothetical protein
VHERIKYCHPGNTGTRTQVRAKIDFLVLPFPDLTIAELSLKLHLPQLSREL